MADLLLELPSAESPAQLWTWVVDRVSAHGTDQPDRLVLSGTDQRVFIWDIETSGSPLEPLTLPDFAALAQAADQRTWQRLTDGDYAAGSALSYVVARLTRGLWHVSLTALPQAPEAARPEVVEPGQRCGVTEHSVLGVALPIVLN